MVRRGQALVALVLYLGTALALPILHQRHHERFGADHLHTASGIVALEAAVELAPDHHHSFDADLAGLGLVEIGHAGIATVDCSLASYTLAEDCGEGAIPHTFGDELLARPHHHPSPLPYDHGRGAFEHLGGWLVCAAPIMLPPRSAPLVAPGPAPLAASLIDHRDPPALSRGPPGQQQGVSNSPV